MSDVAALNLQINSDSVEQANVALREMPKTASAAERSVQKFNATTMSAANSNEQFSRRTRTVTASLEFERQQLLRSSSEREKYAALRRAGVTAMSAEGRAIAASVAALQAQKAATAASTAAAQQSIPAMDKLRGTLAALAGIGAAQTLLRAVDAFTSLTNAIKVTGAEGASLSYVQERLFAAANKNGVAIDALGSLYSRTALAGKELGISQETLLDFVDGVTAALRVQGGSTEEAKGALLQLSQALGSGTVRAEEFNSILEGALPIAQAAARGMDGMGGSVAKLRTAVIAGTVTSKAFFDATMKGFAETKAQAAGASLTIGQSMAALSNSFINYVGQADKASGASGALAKAIAGVGHALDEAAKTSAAGDGGMFDLSKTIATTIEEIQGISTALDNAYKFVVDWASRVGSAVSSGMDTIAAESARGAAVLITAFSNFPSELGKLFVDAWNAAKKATVEGINDLTGWLAAHAPAWMKMKGTSIPFTPAAGGGANPAGFDANVAAAGDAAAARVRDAQAARDMRNRQAGFESDEGRARLGGMPTVGPLGLGGGNAAAAKKGGSDPYKSAIESAREYVLAKNAETAAVGLSAEAAARMTHEQALLNKVQTDGKTATAAQKVEIANLAQQMAEADSRFKTAKFMDDANKSAEQFIASQQIERDTLFMSTEAAMAYRLEQEALNKAKADGIILSDAEKQKLGELASAQAAVAEATRKTKDMVEFAKSTVTGFISDFKQGLEDGKSVIQSFGDAFLSVLNKIADKLVQMAVDDLFNAAFGGKGGGGSSGGGFLTSIIGSVLSGIGGGIGGGAGGGLGGGSGITFANGGAFDRGNVIPFATGGVVSRPTLFPMARGMGLMGEAGPEGVLPLRRGRGGRLGVETTGGGGGGPRIVIEIAADSEWVRATARDESGKVVAESSPAIVSKAVDKSTKIAPRAVERDKQMRAPDWRLGSV